MKDTTVYCSGWLVQYTKDRVAPFYQDAYGIFRLKKEAVKRAMFLMETRKASKAMVVRVKYIVTKKEMDKFKEKGSLVFREKK